MTAEYHSRKTADLNDIRSLLMQASELLSFDAVTVDPEHIMIRMGTLTLYASDPVLYYEEPNMETATPLRDTIDGTAIGEAIEQAKREILQDVQREIIPDTITTFGELHNYVDANEYGGLTIDAEHGTMSTEAANIVQQAVHVWIQAGGLIPVPAAKPHRTILVHLNVEAYDHDERTPDEIGEYLSDCITVGMEGHDPRPGDPHLVAATVVLADEI